MHETFLLNQDREGNGILTGIHYNLFSSFVGLISLMLLLYGAALRKFSLKYIIFFFLLCCELVINCFFLLLTSDPACRPTFQELPEKLSVAETACSPVQSSAFFLQ